MLLPKLTAVQIAWVIQQVAAYIERQRRSFLRGAAPLSQNQRAVVASFFPESTLNSARIVMLRGIRVGNPPFYEELMQMGFDRGSLPDFAHMAAIAFEDTIVSHEPFTNELLFHELVHVVQYEKLGLVHFADKYVTGFLSGGSYEAIPLEMNAYQLVSRFALAPTNPFSVEAEVQAWIDAGRF
jgi:hypothetical protein